MKQSIDEEILALLEIAPAGLSAPELRVELGMGMSQPTLWRHLDALRSKGLVTVAGRGRATRYHSTARINLADLRSRRLHEIVARRLARNPELIKQVRIRLERLREVNPHGRIYHDRWEELLGGPLPKLLQTLTETSEQADALRRESPFTTLIDPEDRRRVFKSLRAA